MKTKLFIRYFLQQAASMKRLVLVFISLLTFPLFSKEQVQSVLPVSTAQNGSITAVAYDWSKPCQPWVAK